MSWLTDAACRIASEFARSTNDAKLTAPVIDLALNDAYVQFAVDTACFTRTDSSLTPLTAVAAYALPADMQRPCSVWYQGVVLTEADPIAWDSRSPIWRDATPGQPRYWLRTNPLEITVHPALRVASWSATTSYALSAWIVAAPWYYQVTTAGSSGATVPAGFATGVTPITEPSGLTWTITALPTLSVYGVIIPYGRAGGSPAPITGGVPLLDGTTNTAPRLPTPFDLALCYWAEVLLANGTLSTDPVAVARGQVAMALYKKMVVDFQATQYSSAPKDATSTWPVFHP